MSILIPFESRYLANLGEMIRAELTRQHDALASGNLITNDAAATGMKMARTVGFIEGLKAALGYMANVHEDMTGKVKTKRKDED